MNAHNDATSGGVVQTQAGQGRVASDRGRDDQAQPG